MRCLWRVGAWRLLLVGHWAPALFKLNYDGTVNKICMLAQTGWETNGIDNIDNTKIDHMKLDTNFSPFKIFGTTRSDNFESKGSQVNVFIVNLDNNHDVA